MLLLSLLGSLAPAHAFCGTYVSDGTSTLTNRASEIVIARSGTSTTLTMFNDFEGDPSAFGLVIPVPEGVDADNVRLADRALLDKLRGYSQPRLVSYTCDDWYGISPEAVAAAAATSGGSWSGGCGGGSRDWYGDTATDTDEAGWEDSGVVIVDEFDLGEYTAWVVDPQGTDGLMAWLAANDFAVSESTAAVFDSYIAAGSHFLALRVDVARLSGTNWLSPLQVGYDSDTFGLPIRMGAASSAGVQDLVVYAVTDPEEGRAAISNYPETPAPEAECLLDLPDGGSLADWYDARFEAATGLPGDPARLDGRQGLAWTTEYGWSSGKCDPCTDAGSLGSSDVEALGFPSFYGWYFTRLHLRYTADAVTEDLTFYGSRITEHTQLRYVERAWELEAALPVCGGEPAADAEPPACYSSEYWVRKEAEGESATDVHHDPKQCAGGAGPSLALLLPPLLFWRRRERRA